MQSKALLVGLMYDHARGQDDINLCFGQTPPGTYVSVCNRNSKAATANKYFIMSVMVPQANFHVAPGNPKNGISIQKTVINPGLWSILR